MKKALVVGGSNGMGLAVSTLLSQKGYAVTILDKLAPQPELLPTACEYVPCDLRFFPQDLVEGYAADPELELLFISAGYGRVAEFEYHHIAEIDGMMQVNAVSALKLLRIFYDRLLDSENPFYCGIMGSISGMLSSPMTAVYAASKAAVCRFVESVNVELEEKGTKNRILNVSPGSFAGSRFNGGQNDLSLLTGLAEQILERLFAREEIFIPEYDTVFRDVLARYHANPQEFGRSSYAYKLASGRAKNEKKVVIGYLSGTFDLFHVGHLNLLRRAKAQCDYLIVGVHESGAWKGKETYIPFEERKEVVAACRYVDKVVQSCPEDSDAWALWHYDKLFVGSDYQGSERFNRYAEYFKDKGVEIVFFPYTKSTSSTQIRNAVKTGQKTDR